MGKGFRNVDKPVLAAAWDDEVIESRLTLPDDPLDARLLLEGAVVGQDGRIDVKAYEDLHFWYAGEPSPDKHPLPSCPGVHRSEEVPKGLRVWDSIRAGWQGDSAGWIVKRTKKNLRKREKWFNIRTCGSWRLAFLLAKLQWDLWERQAASRRSDGQVELSAEAARARRGTRGSLSAPASRRRRAEPGAETPLSVSTPQPSRKKRRISPLDANALSGSIRLQQILAARAAAEKQQQHQQHQQDQQPQQQQQQQSRSRNRSRRSRSISSRSSKRSSSSSSSRRRSSSCKSSSRSSSSSSSSSSRD